MRFSHCGVLVMLLWSATVRCLGDGPQIQVTVVDGKIETRRLFIDAPYASQTPKTSVYVMPVLPVAGIWYSRPNGQINPTTMLPTYTSGPGLAYGIDLADGGPQVFAAGSVLSVGFVDGLKLWNGAGFADAGATQLKAFRGSNAVIATPPEFFAVTTDAAPFDNLSLAALAANYGIEGVEVHSTVRYALLGDGSSPTAASPDGIYLAQLQITSTQSSLAASNPYYFVLTKNAAAADVAAAVGSLNIASGLVQFVPEPATAGLAVMVIGIFSCGRLGRRMRRLCHAST